MSTIAVIGAGVAGLATAEMLQRFPGNKVVLIESSQQLGSGASMDQHGWFHTGNLYSLKGNMASVQAAVANLKIITTHYRSFLNLPDSASSTTVSSRGRWFSDRPIHYVFPNVGTDIADPGKTTRSELQNFLALAPTIAAAAADLNQLRGFDPSLGGLKVVGADTPMHTHLMLADLAGSFLAHGGEVQFSCRYIGHKRGGQCIELSLSDGRAMSVDKLIITSGGELARGQWQLEGLSIRKSPIMVMVRPLCPDNLVVVEDKCHPSLSHILHSYGDHTYSVVSGGYTADANDEVGQANAASALRETVSHYFPSRSRNCEAQVFFGTKVDKPLDDEVRSYSPNLIEVEPDVLIAVPGKFSFAFLLAQAIAERVMCSHGELPAPRYTPIEVDSLLIARPRHETVARALLSAGSIKRSQQAHRQELEHAKQQ